MIGSGISQEQALWAGSLGPPGRRPKQLHALDAKEEDMTSSTPKNHKDGNGESPLAEALQKNQEATEEVQRAADDLAVVHAVLETKTAKGVVDDEEAKRAVAETARVEKRLTESAEKLEQVNETLQKELPKRA
jgi:hypothetical protein